MAFECENISNFRDRLIRALDQDTASKVRGELGLNLNTVSPSVEIYIKYPDSPYSVKLVYLSDDNRLPYEVKRRVEVLLTIDDVSGKTVKEMIALLEDVKEVESELLSLLNEAEYTFEKPLQVSEKAESPLSEFRRIETYESGDTYSGLFRPKQTESDLPGLPAP